MGAGARLPLLIWAVAGLAGSTKFMSREVTPIVCSRAGDAASVVFQEPLPLVLPSEDHTKLVEQESTMEFLAGIDANIAVVAVIGPYRCCPL